MAVCRASIGDAPEFRAQYVRLAAETDRAVTHAAAEIGIGAQLQGRLGGYRLRKEMADLRLDRAFLRNAASFFASESNR